MRTKSRKDLNQVAVVKELRERGYDVDVVERPYDIVVSGKRYFYLQYGNITEDIYKDSITCSVRVELKSEKGKLSDSQKKHIENLKHPGSFIVAYNVEDIEAWFNG